MKNVVVGFRMKFFVILSTVLCGLSSISLNAATSVCLQQATATFSQTEAGDFSVGRTINGTTADGLGWAIYPETGTAHTAAYQTMSDIGCAEGSILTFKLDQSYMGWGEHLLGRFRISVTTDDRSTFCDGLPTGGNVTANWTVLDPISFTSLEGTTLTNLPDGSILASGALPDTDVYTVTAATSLTGITGIRLEALTDPSLPYNGPGRQPLNGNFTLSEFTIAIESQCTTNPPSVGLQQATATFSQSEGGDFSVGTTINGTAADGLGWAIYPQMGTAQTAAYQTTSNIGYADGSLLTFTLDQSYTAPGQHLLGRFRISVTTDDRSTFCDGLPTGGNVTANWTVLDPIVIKSVNGTTLTELSDHSILASGALPDTDVYTVKAQTTLTGITGIRLEALTDPSLPNNGPGRQPLNGNFVLSEFSVAVEPQSTTPEDVGLQKATATFSQSDLGDFSVAYSINGTAADELGWAIYPETNTAQIAAYQTTSDIGYSGGSLLTFTLDQSYARTDILHLLGRFRISVTTDDRSTFCDGLPTGGNVTANWTVLDPISVTSANTEYLDRTKFIKLPDRSILVRGALPFIDVYTVKAHTTLTGITGIRLEALPDPSLPFNGPGRQPLDGTFILSEFSAAIEPQSTVPGVVALQNATATFSQSDGDFSVARTIDGTTADGLGWAIDPQEGAAQTAAYETTSNIGYADGSLLTFTLDQSFTGPGQHLLGHFRISVTTDDRSTFCDGLGTGGNVAANWAVLDPIVFTSFSGTTLTKLSDHSILASGALPDTDVYTVKARTTLTGITGIRLEALTDPSLPNNGPGRQPLNGNFVLSEFTVAIDPDAPITILADTPAESDVEAAISNASDGDTVLIRPGTASWDHRLTIGKGISVIGSGVPATTISADPAFNPADYALMAWSFDGPQTNLVRIAGIMFDCSSNLGAGAIAVFALTDGTVDPPIEHSITAFRIDDCVFNYGFSSIHTLGYTYGVIDHCNFTNNNRAIFIEGDNQFAWNRWEQEQQAHQNDTNILLVGTTRCVCIEDSNFTFDDNWPGSEPVVYQQNGARMTLRYSIFDARAFSGTNFIFVDAHGNFGEQRGTIFDEIYDTTYYSLHNAKSTVFRGGSIIAYEDYMVCLDPDPSGFTAIQLTEEEGHACSFGPPWLTSWPANDQITNSFFWNIAPPSIGYDGGAQDGCEPGTPDSIFIQEGRDYWLDQPQPGQIYYPYNGLIYPHPLVTDPPFLL